MQKIVLSTGKTYDVEDDAGKELFNKINEGSTWILIGTKTKINVAQIVEIINITK